MSLFMHRDGLPRSSKDIIVGEALDGSPSVPEEAL